jgi:altronate dehydratase
MLRANRAAVIADFAAHVLAIASGRSTRSEAGNQRAIAIWKRGVTL